MKTIQIIISSFIISILHIGCYTDYVPDTNESSQLYVIEGYVEAGSNPNPTYVIITKSIPFFSTIEAGKLAEVFVKGASVSVNDGDKETALTEICLSQLPDELKEEVARFLGFTPNENTPDICIYVDILNNITRENGRKYDLKVQIGSETLTATTTIPDFTPLSEFRFDDPPGDPNDTLARLMVTIDEPGDTKNYYRYLTRTDSSALLAPFNSIIDDNIFNGQKFEFPLQKAQRRGGDFDPATFGLYTRGDTISVKWACIDKAHFDFWNTRDFSQNNGGPFASYTRIATNVKGGLGVWGGYATETYTLPVPVK